MFDLDLAKGKRKFFGKNEYLIISTVAPGIYTGASIKEIENIYDGFPVVKILIDHDELKICEELQKKLNT